MKTTHIDTNLCSINNERLRNLGFHMDEQTDGHTKIATKTLLLLLIKKKSCLFLPVTYIGRHKVVKAFYPRIKKI